ncbi:CC/Se motif family (seleno)protein [Vreelandella gomseomensis]|uniref:CC/Se motif family (Seleno)protein n=1 Tax=Vreelandella gomseomensis TaxID=370766 RepID=A0ABU1GDH8_9GAMM|nr:CC/Se motif family (seleno)protein [Halomonas gomseomensis]MDR5875540.1 CC/Se motif family (seleno)protein [Halomonas gomseomensis]
MDDVIEIEDNALAYIKQLGNVLTVRLSPRHGCCGGSANVAVAEAISPKDPSLFQRYHHQGITLFTDPKLTYQGLKINVEGFWKLRHLYVEGASVLAR